MLLIATTRSPPSPPRAGADSSTGTWGRGHGHPPNRRAGHLPMGQGPLSPHGHCPELTGTLSRCPRQRAWEPPPCGEGRRTVERPVSRPAPDTGEVRGEGGSAGRGHLWAPELSHVHTGLGHTGDDTRSVLPAFHPLTAREQLSPPPPTASPGFAAPPRALSHWPWPHVPLPPLPSHRPP